MTVDGSRRAQFRGGVVVPTRVYVDGDGNRVTANSPQVRRLFAPAGATISERDARRLGLLDDEPSGHRCECGYEAKTAAGLGAHRRRHKEDQ